VEALLILALIANLIQRRRAQRLLAESRNRLRAILGSAAEGIITFNEAGIIESVNVAAESIFRYSAAEMIGESVHTFIPTLFGTECAQGVATFEWKPTGHTPNAGREVRGRSKGGSWFPVELTVREVVLPDRRIYTGFVRDITERKRAEQMEREFGKQLLQAQEAERARLARELHDDITQRLALLAVHADRADAGKDSAEQRKTVRGIRDSLRGLSEDVHSLAYKLHPSLLERRGLADALQTECERFSRQESIAVDVNLESLQTPISQEARLCLFRVAQEALRNVARHAGATSAQVSLRSVDGGLQLTVVDNGAGFDPVQDPQRASLGLASMRERVRLLEGKLDIESRRGHGTTVSGWIPLKSQTVEVAAVSGRGKS
jgi:PAS domain S-box-containing protein